MGRLGLGLGLGLGLEAQQARSKRQRTAIENRSGIVRCTRPSLRSGLGSAASKGSTYSSASDSALSIPLPECSASSNGKPS